MTRMSNSQSTSPVHAPPRNSNSLAKGSEEKGADSRGQKKKPSDVAGLDSAAAVFATGGVLRRRLAATSTDGPDKNPSTTSLPAEKVFPIQIGSELFRLSGASISSDG
jgi:hypothetical protein